MTRSPLLRYGIPVAVISVGLVLLTGCLPIPGIPDFKPAVGERPESHIGKPGSGKPLIISQSDRAAVEKFLGSPFNKTFDESRLLYRYEVNTATWYASMIWCFPLYREQKKFSPRFLTVEFDSAGVLKSFRVDDEDPGTKLFTQP